MRRALLPLTAPALALGFAAAAIALSSAARSDPAGDVKHNPPGKDSRYDIVKLTATQEASGQLVDTVKTKGNVLGATRPGSPLLWINVPGKVASRPGCQYSDYFVIAGEVDECGDGPKTGDATVRKLNPHTLEFSFAPAAIGSPTKYGVAFVTEGSNAAGTKLVFFDRGPNKGFLTIPVS